MGKRYYGDIIDTEDLESATRLQEMMGEYFKLLHTENIGEFLPVFRWFDIGGWEKKTTGLMKRIDEFLDEFIGERRLVGSCESGIMVDKLIGLQEQEPELYTDQIIKGFIVHTETPYLTVEWAMALLLNNPHAMETIKNEIHTHIGSNRLLQERDLDKLSFLQNVINESLRLYPTLPLLLPREASKLQRHQNRGLLGSSWNVDGKCMGH